jgi:hypothetical protein
MHQWRWCINFALEVFMYCRETALFTILCVFGGGTYSASDKCPRVDLLVEHVSDVHVLEGVMTSLMLPRYCQMSAKNICRSSFCTQTRPRS